MKLEDVKMGYDIDGVLGEFSDHFLNYFNINDKTPPKKWSDKRFKENFHLTYNNKDFWMTMPPTIDPNSLILMPHCYITARPIPNEWTMEWLWKNRYPYADLYTVGEDGKKADTFYKSGATHFIDDGLHNFDELNNLGIPCFLLSRSHNLDRNTDMRINNLKDLPKFVLNLIKITV